VSERYDLAMRFAHLALVALCDCSGCGQIADEPDTGSDAAMCSNDFGAPSRWTFFDIADVTPPAPGFLGASYVDQHVYFAPALNDKTPSGLIVRESTAAPFTELPSWESFDLTTIDPSFTHFNGTVADAHAVYLFSGSAPIIVRHDSSSPFASSWTSFDVSKVDPQAAQFSGALALSSSVIFYGSWFARYDATMAFDDPTAWRTVDFVGGCAGSAFDGRYTYFGCTSWIERYDTTLAFNSPIPWSTYNLPAAAGVNGAFSSVFDGRYVYFAQYKGTTIVRFDTTAKSFTTDAGWSFVDLQPMLPATVEGFQDVRFDGRYVYATPPIEGSVMARFDTHGSFTDLAAWSSLDLLTLDPRAERFYGSAFDGHYLYFAPEPGGHHVAARYDTTACGD